MAEPPREEGKRVGASRTGGPDSRSVWGSQALHQDLVNSCLSRMDACVSPLPLGRMAAWSAYVRVKFEPHPLTQNKGNSELELVSEAWSSGASGSLVYFPPVSLTASHGSVAQGLLEMARPPKGLFILEPHSCSRREEAIN